jgi:HK97 family phage portal protein
MANRLMQFFGFGLEERSLPRPENEYPLIGAYTGSPVNTSNALLIGDVWSAVRVLADAASSLPLHVYRRGGSDRERVDSGSLVDLLEHPGPGTTQADLVSTLMSHLAIWGNAYLAKFRSGGAIVQLGLLEPDRVRPELEGGELRFRYSPTTGSPRMLTERDVVHVKGLSTDGVLGLSAVTQAARVLGLSDELVKHAVAYFQSDLPHPSGILNLGPDASFAAEDRTKEKIRAEARPHGVMIVRGESSYEQIASKMDDAQFVEQRRLAAQEIARVFRIPSHMLNAGSGGDSLTYSTTEQMSLDFVKYSLTPWLRRIELAISGDTDLTSERQFVKFEVDGLLRADSKTRAEIYRLALDPVQGWMSREEIRRLEDLPPGDSLSPSVEQMIASANGNQNTPAEVGSNGN